MDQIFKKYNPNSNILLESYKYNNKKFTVIQDNILLSAAKERVLYPMIKEKKEKIIIYTGSNNTPGILAVAYVGTLLNKKVILFVPKKYKTSPIRKIIFLINPHIKIKEYDLPLWKIEKISKKYYDFQKNKSNIFYIKNGFKNQSFLEYSVKIFTSIMPKINPKRMWLPIGTGTFFKIFSTIYPTCEFLLVQAGFNRLSEIEDQLKKVKHKIFKSSYKFSDQFDGFIPYETIRHYDGKLWEFIPNELQDGDFIYNLAGDHAIKLKYINSIMDTFPYENIIIKPNILDLLRNYKPKKVKKVNNNNILAIIEENYHDVTMINKTTLYFCQKNLYKCKLGNESPWEYYMKNKDFLDKIQNNKYKLKKIKKSVGQCTLFNITRVVTLLKILFLNKKDFTKIKYLDPSSGWGDRLIGSIALNVNYTGFDPSVPQADVYKNIINYFNYTKAKIYTKPFEKAEINEKYDLVFTSPPFFDYEIYTTDDGQSTENYNTYEEWWNDFFIKMLNNSINSLKKNGYFALYYEDKGYDKNIEEKIKEYLKKKVKYLGNIHFKYDDVNKIRKVMLWKLKL